MAKKERISAQEVLETISGFMELIDEDKLKKLDKLDDIASMKAKLAQLESRIVQQGETISEFIKPDDFEQKVKERDDAFSDAIKKVPTKIDVKTEPVALKQEHVDILDKIKAQYDNISKRHSVYYSLLSSKKMWLLYLFIMALLSVGTTFPKGTVII